MRRLIRFLINAAAALVAWWHVRRYLFLSRCHVATFQHASEAISRIPFFFGYRVRERFYRQLLRSCGERLEVNFGATFAEPGSEVGNDVWIGPFCYVDLCTIGEQVLIGPHVCILAGGHHHRMNRVDVPIRLQGNNPLRRVTIGSGAWIGANAVVMADVGTGAVIGAGAVVTQPIPDFAVAVGSPARVIRTRTASERSVPAAS